MAHEQQKCIAHGAGVWEPGNRVQRGGVLLDRAFYTVADNQPLTLSSLHPDAAEIGRKSSLESLLKGTNPIHEENPHDEIPLQWPSPPNTVTLWLGG